jgi:hypothetical protein
MHPAIGRAVELLRRRGPPMKRVDEAYERYSRLVVFN